MFDIKWLVAIVVGISGVIVLIFILRALLSRKDNPQYVEITQTNPAVEDVFAALEKYAYEGIAAGERAVVWGLDEIEDYIDSADKAAVANFFYDLIPETVVVAGIPVPVNKIKALVPRENFQALVRDLYDGFNARVHQFEAQLVGQIDAMIPDEESEIPNKVDPNEQEYLK